MSNSITPIKLGGYCVNGRMYWDMVSIVVDHINTGALPKFQDMFLTIINKEVNTNLEEAKEIFKIKFTDNVASEMSVNEIDEFYHSSINSVMSLFRRQLDPYLNIGEEIDQLFSEFVQIYCSFKKECAKDTENLDYSESSDDANLLASENDLGPNKNQDEFDINLLNSEYDQPPPSKAKAPLEITPQKVEQQMKVKNSECKI
jgi:hypothetical protein